MDKYTKIALGILGIVYVRSIYRIHKLTEEVRLVEEIVDVIDQIQDNMYQGVIDARFAEIAENYDD